MKILFISSNPFGLMGTPGTYLLVEAYSQKADICVIANKDREDDFRIVHKPSDRLLLHEVSFSREDYLINISQIMSSFDPDIVNVTSFPGWTQIVDFLKEVDPRPKYVCDIKSPHLAPVKSKRSKRIKKRGQNSVKNIDLVLTRSLEDIPTWIPQCTKPSLMYPLGVRLADYSPRKPENGFSVCTRFVYVGAIAPFRKLDTLLEYIAALPKDILETCVFDFLGSGPSENDIISTIQRLGLEKNVTFRGCVDTDALPKILSDYDAGIAWVPYELFDASPSLKIVEYTAAGLLPIAMDTTAHRRFSERGFYVSFFSNTLNSFVSAITQSCQEGFSEEKRIRNLSVIQEYDWETIVDKYLLPSFYNLIGQSGKKTLSAFSTAPNYLEQFSTTYEEASPWNIDLSPSKPQPRSKSKNRIAAILTDRLYKSISLECDLFLLTPKSWDSVLSYARPEFLLIESGWSTVSGHWNMAQYTPGKECRELIEIVEKAKEIGIPTVFWMTMDSLFHKYFFDFSKHFDFVFCADPKEVALMHKDGISAKTMLPAVQPVLFNSIQNVENLKKFDAGILFDGVSDLVRVPEISDTLKQLTAYNLNIYQSTLFLSERYFGLIDSKLLPDVKGAVRSFVMPTLLRHASVSISFEKSAAGNTHQKWSALEAAACQIPIAHMGRIETDDLRYNIVKQFENESEFCDYVIENTRLNHFDEDGKHKAWRETLLNHTIAKRLQAICTEIGVVNDWVEFPRVSLVTEVRNPELILKCVEQYESQTFPNKELLLIFSGNLKTFEHYRQEFTDRDDVNIFSVATTPLEGTVLNFCLSYATGEYFFCLDEDHTYGKNYIMDSMLHLRATKAEILGKNAVYYQKETTSGAHSVTKEVPKVRLFPAKELLTKQDTYFVKGSLAGKIETFRKNLIPWNSYFVEGISSFEYLKRYCAGTSCLVTDQFEFDEKLKNYSIEKYKIHSSTPPAKKILFIGPWKFAANVGKKNVRVIYPSLLEPLSGCEFHILHGKPHLPHYTNELTKKYGVKYHCVKKRNVMSWIKAAVSLIKKYDIDVVTNVFFGYYLGNIAARAAQETNRKSVVRFAGNELYVRKCAGTYNGFVGKIRHLKERKMEKNAIDIADAVIGMSPWEVNRIKRISSSPGLVKWCMRGINTNEYASPHEREYKRACKFLYVGRKSKEKGYKLIEKVANNLYSKYPDFRFYFVGNFEQGEEKNRYYIGYCSHDHLKQVYFECDALILPSESEGFANVIVEAMSMGMPCIISESFHKDYFKHKENAMLTALTVDSLEKNIIAMHNDRKLYKKLSINARALAVDEFDSKNWADKYRSIIVG